MLKSKTPRLSHFALDAALDIRVRIVQDITISEDHMRTLAGYHPPKAERNDINNDRIMSVVEMNLCKGRVILDKTPDGSKVDTR